MSDTFNMRRGDAQGPHVYTLEQLQEMAASNELLETDEVCRVGEDQWTPVSAMNLGNQAGPPPPPGQASPNPVQVVMDLPDDTLLWIHRGAIGFMFIMVFLPWMSMGSTVPSGFGAMGDSISVSLSGLNFGGGVLVFLAIVASGILSFLESTKYWSWIGTAVAGLVSFIFAIAPPVSASYSDGYSSASIGAGFGPWLCFLGAIVATAAGLFVFLKYIKNKPLSVPPAP